MDKPLHRVPVIFAITWLTVSAQSNIINFIGENNSYLILLTHTCFAVLSSFFIYALALLPTAKNHQNEFRIMQSIAMLDELTGLPNRRGLAKNIESLLSKRRTEFYGALLVDLDKFKPINDEYGHAVGDQVLKAVSKSLSKNNTDFPSRLGGDEFFIITSALGSDRKSAESLIKLKALKVLGAVRNDIIVNGLTFNVGSSIGAYIITPEDSDSSQILRKADAAMYSAKKTGESRIHLFSREADFI